MTILPFEVNDRETRQRFLRIQLDEILNKLNERSSPLWGKMSAQHMIEHLIWTFEISAGEIAVYNNFPADHFVQIKKFLYDNRLSPKLYKNPMLGEEPPDFRFKSLIDTKNALHQWIIRFHEYYKTNPDIINHHPIFGPLNAEEWERTHYKHCFHHMMQFGLLEI